MIRLLLFACLALAVILLFQRDLSATGYQAQISTRLAQDDSDNAQTAPDPSTTSDTGIVTIPVSPPIPTSLSRSHDAHLEISMKRTPP
jgi:hypothetical protein